MGSYGSINGTGIRDVVNEVDPALATEITAKIAESLANANALDVPFDASIAMGNDAGRAKVQALITSLREQESLLEDVFRKFDLMIPQPE